MKKSSYCYTTSSSNHLCKQSPYPSTAFQTSMSPFIYHILLPLADLSLIYSCRLHSQSICHATRSINLHTGCIPHDWSIFILAAYPATRKSAYPLLNWFIHISAACSEMEESAYQLHNWSICIPAACSAMKEPAYLLATQLANLHISCMLRDGRICLPATQLINLHTSCILRDRWSIYELVKVSELSRIHG